MQYLYHPPPFPLHTSASLFLSFGPSSFRSLLSHSSVLFMFLYFLSLPLIHRSSTIHCFLCLRLIPSSIPTPVFLEFPSHYTLWWLPQRKGDFLALSILQSNTAANHVTACHVICGLSRPSRSQREMSFKVSDSRRVLHYP